MNQIPLPQSASAEHPEADEHRDDKTREIAPDLAYRQTAIVNVIFFGQPLGIDRARRGCVRLSRARYRSPGDRPR